jgi:hypothetical protein
MYGIFLQKLISFSASKESQDFIETVWFIALLTNVCHYSLLWISLISPQTLHL